MMLNFPARKHDAPISGIAQLAPLAANLERWKRERLHIDIGIVLFSVALIFWLGIAAISQTRFERQEAIDAAIDANNNLAVAFEQYVARTLQQADTALLVLRREYARAGPALDIASLFDDGVLDRKQLLLAVIADERGGPVAASPEQTDTSSVNLADREHFQVHVAHDTGRPFVGKPVRSRLLGLPVIPITRRINKPDGSFGGVAIVLIDPAHFTEFYKNADFGPLDVLSVLQLDGTTLSRRVGPRPSSGENVSQAGVFAAQREQPNGWYRGRGALDGVMRFYSYRSLPEYSLIAVSGITEAAVLAHPNAHARRANWSAAIVTLVVTVFGALVLVVLARRRRVRVALAESEARLRATFDQAGTGIMRSAIDGRVLEANAKACAILGYSADELAAMNLPRADPQGRCCRQRAARPCAARQRPGGEHKRS